MNGVIVSFFALVAVASAGLVVPSVYNAYNPLAYGAYSAPYAYSSPYAYSAYAAPAASYAAHVATPYAASYAAPYAAPFAAPYAAQGVVAYSGVPAIQSGYVAANRGAIHTAPLPEGPHAASHHINTAPAPGTI